MRTRSTIRNTLEKEEERIRMRIVERRMRTPSLSCDRITPFQPRSFFAGREGLPPEPSDCPVLNGQTPYSGLRFVFISGSPGGGTTSLYSLISSSHNVANMCGLAGPFCEGGFLAVGKNCHDMEGIAQTEACAANAVSSRTGFARIIGAYRKIWDSKSRRLYVEKTPGLNLVWAPHLVDYLVSQGVNASAITFMILTRSPCYPGKELRHRIGVEDHTFMPIWSDPQLARQWGPGQRSPARAELANRTHRNVSFAFRQRWELERTMGTLAQVNRRGAHAVVVDYQAMLSDPQGVSQELSRVTPCLGKIDPERRPELIFRQTTRDAHGRGESLMSFSKRTSTANSLKEVESFLAPVLRRLGYLEAPSEAVRNDGRGEAAKKPRNGGIVDSFGWEAAICLAIWNSTGWPTGAALVPDPQELAKAPAPWIHATAPKQSWGQVSVPTPAMRALVHKLQQPKKQQPKKPTQQPTNEPTQQPTIEPTQQSTQLSMHPPSRQPTEGVQPGEQPGEQQRPSSDEAAMREQRMRQYLMRAAGYTLAALSLCLLVCVLVVLLAALRGCCGRSRKQKVRKRRPRRGVRGAATATEPPNQAMAWSGKLARFMQSKRREEEGGVWWAPPGPNVQVPRVDSSYAY